MWKEGTFEEGLSYTQAGERQRESERGKTKAFSDIEETNVVSKDEGDILLNLVLDVAHMVTTDDIVLQDWILDSGVSFHVTPHREWFTNYDVKRTTEFILATIMLVRLWALVMCS